MPKEVFNLLNFYPQAKSWPRWTKVTPPHSLTGLLRTIASVPRIKPGEDCKGKIAHFKIPTSGFFLVTLKGDSHQILLPADNDAPRITVSDTGYLILAFDDFPSENLLLIRKEDPDDLTEEEFSALSQSEILRVFYKVYPKENDDKIENFAYSAACVNYFAKLESKSGVLRIVTERHGEYDMKEYAEDLHESVSSLSGLVFMFRAEASSNLSSYGIH